MTRPARALGRVGAAAALAAGGVLLAATAQAATPPPGAATNSYFATALGNGYIPQGACDGAVVQTVTLTNSPGEVRIHQGSAHGYCIEGVGVRTDVPSSASISQYPTGGPTTSSYDFAVTKFTGGPTRAGVAADPASNPCIRWSFTLNSMNVQGVPKVSESIGGTLGSC